MRWVTTVLVLLGLGAGVALGLNWHNSQKQARQEQEREEIEARAEEVRELGEPGPDAAAAIETLAKSLCEDPASEVRLEAAEALRRLEDGSGRAAIALALALRDIDAEVRKRAAELLGAIGAAAKAVRPFLERAVHDEVPEVSQAAKEAIAQIDRAVETEPRKPRRTAVRAMTFQHAVQEGLVEVTGITGGGLTTVDLDLRSRSTGPLRLLVPVGMWFRPADVTVQNMIVRKPVEISVPAMAAGSTEALHRYRVPVACLNMNLTAPTERDRLSLQFGTPSGDLALLLATPEFAEADHQAKQYAIWTLTDNPPRGQYLAIKDGRSAQGRVRPAYDPAVFDRVRDLLRAAGIDVRKYQAFAPPHQ